MTVDASPSRALASLRVGRDLMLDVFEVWRRDLPCLDALILLAISMANVDGILFDRELRRRYGGAFPIAPDHVQQTLSASAVAASLGLPSEIVRRRVEVLASRGECLLTASGMIVSEHQLEAADRAGIIASAYAALRESYWRLKRIGLFDVVDLPAWQVSAAQPARSATAFAAKYILRTLDSFSGRLGDVRNTLILLQVMRAGEAPTGPPRAASGTTAVAAALGLSPEAVRLRLRALIAARLCERRGRGLAVSPGLFAEPWFRDALDRNLENLFQLFAALAEVGALADFDAPAAHGLI